MTDDNNTDEPVDVIPTVAQPRSHFSREIYTGAELHVRPVRAGAGDALALPSLFNGKRTTRAEIRDLITQPSVSYAPPKPMRRVSSSANFITVSGHTDALKDQDGTRRFWPVSMKPGKVERVPGAGRSLGKLRDIKRDPKLAATYEPRPESMVGRTLAHLQAHGGYLLFPAIDRMFGTIPANRASMFQAAVRAGVLIRVVIDGQGAYALPGYIAPPDNRPRGTPGTVTRAKFMLGVHARQLLKLENKVSDVRTKIADLQAIVADYERALK